MLVLLACVLLNDTDAGGSALRDSRAGESCNAHEQREDERQRGGSFAVGTACSQKEEAGDQDRQSRKAISADTARAVGQRRDSHPDDAQRVSCTARDKICAEPLSQDTDHREKKDEWKTSATSINASKSRGTSGKNGETNEKKGTTAANKQQR